MLHSSSMYNYARKEWIEQRRPIELSDCFLRPPEQGKTKGIMMRYFAGIWIQFLAATEGALGGRPIALIIQFHRCQQVVGWREGVVQGETFTQRRFGGRPVFVRREKAIHCPKGMITTQSHVSRRIRRAERNSLFEVFPHALITRSKEVFPLVAPFQIELVRFEIFGRTPGDGAPFRGGQLRLQRIGYPRRDLAFDSKNIVELSIIAFGPEVRVTLRVD